MEGYNMLEKNGKIEKWDRVSMNYYSITDKDYENNQEVYIDDGEVFVYDSDGILLEHR